MYYYFSKTPSIGKRQYVGIRFIAIYIKGGCGLKPIFSYPHPHPKYSFLQWHSQASFFFYKYVMVPGIETGLCVCSVIHIHRDGEVEDRGVVGIDNTEEWNDDTGWWIASLFIKLS